MDTHGHRRRRSTGRKVLGRRWFRRAFNSCISVLLAWVYLWAEVLRYWGECFYARLARPSPSGDLQRRLVTAYDYASWYTGALEWDRLQGNDDWRRNPLSSHYDHRLIDARLAQLCEFDLTQDLTGMLFLLRSGLVRNLGGLNEPVLFTRAAAGTKILVEEYTRRVVHILTCIRDATGPAVPRHLKASFFYDTRQCYGRTVLVLNGGSTFGLCHLGVAKALWENRLLPRIIYGTAVGSLIAALICCHSDAELPDLFSTARIDLSAFRRVARRGHVARKLNRLLKFGYLLNVRVLEDCTRDNIGDTTFAEAYAKTGRILNIKVAPYRRHEPPQLLNYLTAPNVVIWSAACASTAALGLFERGDLLVKDAHGTLAAWHPPGAAIPTSKSGGQCGPVGDYDYYCGDDDDDDDLVDVSDPRQPYTRLAELFNVNHSIVSDASPRRLPLWSSPPAPLGHHPDHHRLSPTNLVSILGSLAVRLGRLAGRLVTDELQHRLAQLRQLRLLPAALESFTVERTAASAVIAPTFRLTDFYNMYASPTPDSLPYWILKGEQATWPEIPLIRNRCAIEFTLDAILDQSGEAQAVPAAHAVTPPLSSPPRRKRTMSFH
ncbi:triacylglycerol lipase [Tieghemiomyces parasiticus]|uniref:Triacylglycerol lipase n=1 Tax=Tieghemiomyces parasiticus TaxID=78921 RepID=A0A9W8ACM4_9FUNG|nr:triacylglycerol lipase [Tieghemiomyces parasiticus]